MHLCSNSCLTFRNGIKRRKRTAKGTLPAPQCHAHWQGQENRWDQLQILPHLCCSLLCPAHLAHTAMPRGFHCIIKLYTQNYLNIGRPTVSTAQERCLVTLETQISAEEFELWSCFLHIMLLSPTFTSFCSLAVNSFPSNRMAAK